MPTCSIEGCERSTFHDDPPLCLEHTIAADPEAGREVALVDLIAAEDAPAEAPSKRRTTTT